MPFLAGLISSFFGYIAALLAKRLTIGLAAAGAFVVTGAAAFLAVKLALAGVVAGLSAVTPPAIVLAAGYFMPDNLAPCLTAILLGDAIITSYDYWRSNLGVAVQLAKG